MAYGTVNADVIGTSVQGYSLGAGNSSLLKNKIINGAMVIDQRNAGASITPAPNAYITDRWVSNNSQSSKLSLQQNAGSVTPPVGFSNYLGATSLSAYSISATDNFTIRQYIEGYNFSDLGWGTANAKTVTLSFQVYSSLTGTFGGSINNYAFSRSFPFSYSVPVANTWTTISVTIAGDTSGTWVGSSNAGAVALCFSLGTGSTYSGTAGSWGSTLYLSTTGATSVVGTNGATFYITGVQLEVGSSATGFEYRQYQQELALCQRYAYKYGGAITDNYGNGVGLYYDANTIYFGSIQNPVPMRATPALTTYGSPAVYTSGSGTSAGWTYAIAVPNYQNTFVQANKTSHGVSVSIVTNLHFTTADYFIISAEL